MKIEDINILEFVKCNQDPLYAIEKYLKIAVPTSYELIHFEPYKKQKDILNAYEKNRFNIIKKSRQAGVTTTTAAYVAVKLAFSLDFDKPEFVVILDYNLSSSEFFLKLVKEFLYQLPRWVWGTKYYGDSKKNKLPFLIVDNKREIKLPNGSLLKIISTHKDGFRGLSPTHVIIDNAAMISKGNELLSVIMPSLSTGGKLTITSTPNGFDGLFFRTYEQAKVGCNPFNIIDINWFDDPTRIEGLYWFKDNEKIIDFHFTDELYKTMIENNWALKSYWYDQMCKGLNEDPNHIAQELDASFVFFK